LYECYCAKLCLSSLWFIDLALTYSSTNNVLPWCLFTAKFHTLSHATGHTKMAMYELHEIDEYKRARQKLDLLDNDSDVVAQLSGYEREVCTWKLCLTCQCEIDSLLLVYYASFWTCIICYISTILGTNCLNSANVPLSNNLNSEDYNLIYSNFKYGLYFHNTCWHSCNICCLCLTIVFVEHWCATALPFDVRLSHSWVLQKRW